ncbi:MAG TPA: SRPBCC family protein [Polyangiaceae bacterium]|nr:SRPBCC family protein [Polyangiaceae bacterium]
MSKTEDTDRIERQIELKAPVSRVWRALADAREFASWFGFTLEHGEFAPGAEVRGRIRHKGYEHVVFAATVVQMDPERLISWRWHPAAVEAGVDYSAEPTTLVTFELKKLGNGTLLKVVESGFASLPPHRRVSAHRMNGEGWDHQMIAIERHVDKSGQS